LGNLKLPSPYTNLGVRADTFINDQLGTKLEAEAAKFLAEQFKRLWSLSTKEVHPSSPASSNEPTPTSAA
jgi:hypothetical protein